MGCSSTESDLESAIVTIVCHSYIGWYPHLWEPSGLLRYKPLSHSDVAKFADAYSKAWLCMSGKPQSFEGFGFTTGFTNSQDQPRYAKIYLVTRGESEPSTVVGASLWGCSSGIFISFVPGLENFEGLLWLQPNQLQQNPHPASNSRTTRFCLRLEDSSSIIIRHHPIGRKLQFWLTRCSIVGLGREPLRKVSWVPPTTKHHRRRPGDVAISN